MSSQLNPGLSPLAALAQVQNDLDRFADAPEFPGSSMSRKIAQVLQRLTNRRRKGLALDVGTGFGDDAIWLAERGWRVTAVDISRVALDRAKAEAVARGVSAQIAWLPVDLLEWSPPAQTFDLVTSQFIHFQQPLRDKVFRRLASAVKPRGTLLIVGHDPSDLLTTAKRWSVPGGLHAAPEVAALLDPAEWTLEAVAARPREATDPAGRSILVHDAVVRARRVPADGAD